MARKVTQEDIQYMNDLYYLHRSYTEVAKQSGWSAATVRKYVVKDYVPLDAKTQVHFDPDKDLPPFDSVLTRFAQVDNFGDLCVLSDDEKKEIEDLWKELRA